VSEFISLSIEDTDTKPDRTVQKYNESLSMLYDEQIVSDDDDFPDEQEILRTTGLTDFNKPLAEPVRH
jgi:hypothetical protein